MTVLQLFQYFKSIAINHKQIAHTEAKPKFAQIDFEAQNGIRTTLDTTSPVLLLDFPSGSVQGKSLHNLLDYFSTRFAVVQHVRKDDFEAERQAHSLCLEIGKEIIRYLFTDQLKDCEVEWLSPTITYQPVYMLDNAVGYAFQIQFYTNFNYTITPDSWLV